MGLWSRFLGLFGGGADAASEPPPTPISGGVDLNDPALQATLADAFKHGAATMSRDAMMFQLQSLVELNAATGADVRLAAQGVYEQFLGRAATVGDLHILQAHIAGELGAEGVF